MRYHYPIFCVCEGTSEQTPCTASENGGGMVAMGVLRISDGGPELGRADQVTPPEGWKPLKVDGPKIRRQREKVSPMSSPWVLAAATGQAQMALVCPKCAEHLKLEDLVVEAKVAAEKGQVQ